MTLALTFVAAIAAASATPPRFSGEASLSPPAAQSADARFRIEADLMPGDRAQHGGRYALDARLDASAQAKSSAAIDACGAVDDSIFQDGFE